MALTKKIDFNKVKKKVINGRQKKLKLEANNIIDEIVNRTLYGKDINNRQFRPYTKAYYRSKKKSHGAKKVNLKRSGDMLDDITWEELKGGELGIKLYFASGSEGQKAYWNYVTFKRKFFGTDRRQEKRIAERLGKL